MCAGRPSRNCLKKPEEPQVGEVDDELKFCRICLDSQFLLLLFLLLSANHLTPSDSDPLQPPLFPHVDKLNILFHIIHDSYLCFSSWPSLPTHPSGGHHLSGASLLLFPQTSNTPRPSGVPITATLCKNSSRGSSMSLLQPQCISLQQSSVTQQHNTCCSSL